MYEQVTGAAETPLPSASVQPSGGLSGAAAKERTSVKVRSATGLHFLECAGGVDGATGVVDGVESLKQAEFKN